MDDLPPNEVLRAMFRTGQVLDAQGTPRELQGNISQECCCDLYRVVRERKPRLVVEIGLANGASTISILAALSEAGNGGRLISIDPYQSRQFSGIGRLNVERAGFSQQHELREEPSYLALPQLLREGASVDLAYIDGYHTFDYTLVDFFFLDKLLGAGGVVGFNDCGMRSVRRVIRFVQTHRKYAYLPVTRTRYAGRNAAVSLARWVLRFPTNDHYFEKIECWEPDWDYYRRF